VREREGAEPRAVVVLTTLGAPQRRLLGGRRSSRSAAPAPPPEPVATGRATIVDPERLDEHAGHAWLRGLDTAAEIDRAVRTLNFVMHAHRVATADPYVHELSPAQALVIRAGFGDGERVADGRWSEAVELRAPGTHRHRRRATVLRPQERLAALLGARDSALETEELALRARADLNAERFGAAALGTRLAIEAAQVELAPLRASHGMSERLDELRELRDDVIAAANAALAAPLTDPQRETVEHALGRVEAALRARTASALQ
jgi:hypothetical protein